MLQHTLPRLPYAKDALEPHISAETLEFHYGKHHATYVDTLNDLIADTEFEDAPLEQIIQQASGSLFNNAAQVWNHTFYWHCLDPEGGGEPRGPLGSAIDTAFGDFNTFKSRFAGMAADNFGSGWTWLVKNSEGGLEIVNSGNAGNPMTEGKQPILACDVWEHAYYIDYRNSRADYVEALWNLVNWEFASQCFEEGEIHQAAEAAQR